MHNTLRHLSCFLFGFISLSLCSQNIDSLRTVISEMPNDSNKVNELNSISWPMLFQLRDSSEVFIEEAIAIAREIGFSRGEATALKSKGVLMDMRGQSNDALDIWNESQQLFASAGDLNGQANVLNNMGMGYKALGDFKAAKEYYNKSIELSKSIGLKTVEAKAFNNLAIVYDVQGDFQKAAEYYLYALEINRELDNAKLISGNLKNLGVINQEIYNFPAALNYFKQSLEIDEELGRNSAIARTLTNIGYTFYLKHNGNNSKKNLLDSAIVYYNEALEIQVEFDNKSEIAQLYNNLGMALNKKKEHEKAIPLLQKAIDLRTELEDQAGIIYTNIPMGEALIKLGRTKEGIKKLEFSRKASIRDQIWTNIIDADEVLAEAYESIGKYQLAYLRIQEKDSIYDLSLDEEKNSAIHQTQTDHIKKLAKAQQERDEAVIEANKAQRKFFIGGIIMAIVAALALLNRYRYVRKNRNIIAAEKQKSDDLLLNILPEETAEELKEKGTAEAQRFKEVSIMFTDFKGFTAASGVMDPAALVSILHECFSAFDDIIGKYNIEKIKTIGDAYMCVSGLPTRNPNHAKDLVSAGLEFQSYVDSKQGKDFPFTMRLGIHTGSVVSGIVGKKKFAYDIWGDAVNTAARMESKGEIGRVNISQATYEIIKDDFECEPRGAIEAKGKGKLEMYFVNSKIQKVKEKVKAVHSN